MAPNTPNSVFSGLRDALIVTLVFWCDGIMLGIAFQGIPLGLWHATYRNKTHTIRLPCISGKTAGMGAPDVVLIITNTDINFVNLSSVYTTNCLLITLPHGV